MGWRLILVIILFYMCVIVLCYVNGIDRDVFEANNFQGPQSPDPLPPEYRPEEYVHVGRTNKIHVKSLIKVYRMSTM